MSRRILVGAGICTLFAGASCADPYEAPDSLAAALTGGVLLVPTRDIDRSGISADGDSTNLYRDIDDGTSFASADDSTTTIRNSWSASSATYTAGYSGTLTNLASVKINLRAKISSGVVGSVRVDVYDGTTVVAKGMEHLLSATWTDYTETHTGLAISSVANLRTRVAFTRTGSSGYLRCTQLFLEVASGSSPSPDAGTIVDSGTTVDAGTASTTSPTYVVTDPNLVFSLPAVPKPSYLAPIRPQPFGARVIRIAGDANAPVLSGSWSADARHHYSKDQPWSSDGSLIALQNAGTAGVIYLDGATYAPRLVKCPGYALGDDRWHPSSAHPHERINVRSSALSWFDVTTCTTTRSWTLPFAVDGFGSGEGNPSRDGRYAVLGDSTRMFVVDMAAYPTTRIGPSRAINECGLSSCTVDWVSVSASGKYAIVAHEGDHLRVFDVDPATLALTVRPFSGNTICSGSSQDGFIYDLGHADMTLDPFDGNEDIIVGQEHCGRVGQTVDGHVMGHVVKVRLRDGRVTPLTAPTNEAYAHHVSTRNVDRPGWAYVGYQPGDGKRFNDEIISVKLDGTGAVERWAHKRSVFSGCYRCESHAVPAPDGLRVIFASNWATACGTACGSTSNIQAYVVDGR